MTITKRGTKGSELTWAEIDANWDELINLLTKIANGNLLIGSTTDNGSGAILQVNGKVSATHMLSGVGTTKIVTSNSATPSASGCTALCLNYSTPTNITAITGGVTGQILVVLGTNFTLTRSNAYLANGSDYTPSNANQAITLIYNGSNWLELARTNNNS